MTDPVRYSIPRQRASHRLPCARCQHLDETDTTLFCALKQTDFPNLCTHYEPITREYDTQYRWRCASPVPHHR